MSTLQDFMDMGERSGLTGADLRNWAKQELKDFQTQQREERAEKLAAEKEAKQLQASQEREKLPIEHQAS